MKEVFILLWSLGFSTISGTFIDKGQRYEVYSTTESAKVIQRIQEIGSNNLKVYRAKLQKMEIVEDTPKEAINLPIIYISTAEFHKRDLNLGDTVYYNLNFPSIDPTIIVPR